VSYGGWTPAWPAAVTVAYVWSTASRVSSEKPMTTRDPVPVGSRHPEL